MSLLVYQILVGIVHRARITSIVRKEACLEKFHLGIVFASQIKIPVPLCGLCHHHFHLRAHEWFDLISDLRHSAFYVFSVVENTIKEDSGAFEAQAAGGASTVVVNVSLGVVNLIVTLGDEPSLVF